MRAVRCDAFVHAEITLIWLRLGVVAISILQVSETISSVLSFPRCDYQTGAMQSGFVQTLSGKGQVTNKSALSMQSLRVSPLSDLVPSRLFSQVARTLRRLALWLLVIYWCAYEKGGRHACLSQQRPQVRWERCRKSLAW